MAESKYKVIVDSEKCIGCGLGVLFSGFFTMVVNMSGKVRRLMGIRKNPKAVTTMVIGYPAVKYHKTVHRKSANVIEA